MKNILTLAFVLLFVGCVSVGTQFDISRVQMIERGKTTRAEVEGWFGKPYGSQKYESGSTELVWMHTVVQAMSGVNEQKILKIIVDGDGIVKDYSINETRPPGKNLTGKAMPRDKQNPKVGMSQAEILAMYGKPKSVTRRNDGETWMYDNSELAAVPFNFGYSYKKHEFTFDKDGTLTQFTLGDF